MRYGQTFFICDACEIAVITQAQVLEAGKTVIQTPIFKCQNCGGKLFHQAVVHSAGPRKLTGHDAASLSEE